MEKEISIFVENLARRNAGNTKGAWFTLPVPFNTIARKIGLSETEEEWIITDYEAPFDIGEYDNINKLNRIAAELDNIPDYLWENARDLLSSGIYENIEDFVNDPERVIYLPNILEDNDLGSYLVEHNTWYDVPDNLASYINTRKFGQDYRFSTDGFFAKTGFFISA
ncbi:antirestriction protein ArdA [Liquorilactobacillus satsumensis]|uniref:antirestriction protein ArdA n=1 Tax=Liquorilactobacillus satsumensis TaxID=259059 RepID=UPI0021C3911D|nr:antirestriction protein ArdA [Liquorilactobacillus satsumensis]MCP9356717.1 antirestriction protein ArdA [Liquorilactobacillus satsumensis]MCP9370657.1 antirestriction protein ArdA [Liquorilactobacillus satsumensis]